ncbi:hypothetical protein HME9304_00542 [Flagellimonas maritima]|uniref:Uncharacterized protein n=1 Tax=Flagellimonas maritima TaxID=1383885 RepID=A0A2Z4LP68_9FLAO|nr:hypothetical protein [Allomuricauda aurantiaca]AWX43553.1 hypothetical protein HME9304_00542 [Allomuricauda aurantiaca]
MKNTKKIAYPILGAIFLFLGACQQTPKKEDPNHEPEPTPQKVKPPKQIITLEESKSLYDNYTKNRVELIRDYELHENKDEKFKPSRFIAFDYDTMKQYMAFIEQEANEAKVDISTIRFYFANYPNEGRFSDGQKVVHPRQNSIFMLPTMNVNGQNYGFYIDADGNARRVKDAVSPNGIGNTSKTEGKSYASFGPSFSNAFIAQEDQSLTLNHGSSGPPPSGDF